MAQLIARKAPLKLVWAENCEAVYVDAAMLQLLYHLQVLFPYVAYEPIQVSSHLKLNLPEEWAVEP